MAAAYKTPGVYIEEIPKFPPSIAPVETAIPAFIGYTQKADGQVAADLRLKPTRIASMVEYETRFGGPQPETGVTVAVTGTKAVAALTEATRSKHIMYYALQLFFAAGGGPCHIVSVGGYKAAVGDALVETELQAGLAALVKQEEPTLIVFPEAQNLAIADCKALYDAALLQCAELKNRFVIMDAHGDNISLADPSANLLTAIDNFRNNGVGANNLKYGAAYAPNLETVLDFSIDETKTSVAIDGGAAVMLDTLQASSNRVYELAKAAIRDMPCKLPPAAAMAGVYAAVDNFRGVWKAPANVSLNAVIQPAIPMSNKDQESLNVDATAGKSVNALRTFLGKGPLAWGARTLAGNDNEWRYVNVRRFFNFAEDSIKKATSQFVFEPNDANTWVKVQAMIENFLTTLWRQGALQGVKPEHAFYVAVGLGKTMTPQDILEGRLIVEVGMAAVRPAEFIVLRFSHKMAES
ncbi:phage tail sheath C-terminal domain-containing protein [Candidatus Thiothrix sp. Deng01]|uniref:Phage tail sheath C-terminal domain-containing protein n=1 Tax=Candidatus Thiothrix phosphatis TaxID=3112415 RepID=A0ABU6D2U9_9GAMM|nr:phage tail sheath C-terminal domain-containing protein [Candidatus Thiothrix sp. Deng01]MEB4593410.1 phage tail sheath C-terminal domain-containing protein [Candidatus Thiothrix sp. Deng01]